MNGPTRDFCAEALASVGLEHEAAREQELEIKRLAGMSSLEYCRARKTNAKHLGIGVAELDKLVREARKTSSVDDDPDHWVIEPYPHPVDGVRLLDELKVEGPMKWALLRVFKP